MLCWEAAVRRSRHKARPGGDGAVTGPIAFVALLSGPIARRLTGGHLSVPTAAATLAKPSSGRFSAGWRMRRLST